MSREDKHLLPRFDHLPPVEVTQQETQGGVPFTLAGYAREMIDRITTS